MKFEYLILLILAFNVIAAVIKKRKADAASRPKAPPPPPDPRREVGRARDARAPGQASGAEAAEGAVEAPPRKGMGRDLLEQLAKELGLETEAPERPRPETSPYKPEYRPEPEAMPEGVAVVPPATKRAPRKVSAPTAPVAPAEAPSMRRAPALELRDREALRRAVIAKEILGPPVSRGRAR